MRYIKLFWKAQLMILVHSAMKVKKKSKKNKLK